MESGCGYHTELISYREIAALRAKIEQRSFPTAPYVQGHAGISVNVQAKADIPLLEDRRCLRAVEAELARLTLARKVHPGDSVAIACGSRQIANHAVILKTVVDHFKDLKAHQFLVPAMGLDAGGTAESQHRALGMFGITEEMVGAEIRSSRDAEVVGHVPEGVPVYCDRNALAADHIVVVNRVRPHSALDGEVQSGLLKMLAMGLGKEDGAQVYHSGLATMPFADLARGVWNVFLNRGRLLAGLMLVENRRSETARIQAASAEHFADWSSRCCVTRAPCSLDSRSTSSTSFS